MGGVFKKIIDKAIGEGSKAIGLAPSKDEIEAAKIAAEKAAAKKAAAEKAAAEKAAAEDAQKQVNVVDATSPGDVVYAGEKDSDAQKKKKKRRSGTILTSSKGVMGDAPTEQKTLLGG